MKNSTQGGPTANASRYAYNYAKRFAAQIVKDGYSPGSVAKYRSTAEALWAAMLEEDLCPAKLTDDCIDQLTLPIIGAAFPKDQKHCRYRINRFRDYLIENAGAPTRSEPPLDMSPRACLKRDYETYLRVQRGLSEDTIYHCLRFFDRFLTAKFGTGLGDLNKIKPGCVTCSSSCSGAARPSAT